MSETMAARGVKCPTCGAEVGDRCREVILHQTAVKSPGRKTKKKDIDYSPMLTEHDSRIAKAKKDLR